MSKLIKNVGYRANLYRDDPTGIAWIEDNYYGILHSVHPNIDCTGSAEGMVKRGYWNKDDITVRAGNYIYNISKFVSDGGLDEIVADECMCTCCVTRRAAEGKDAWDMVIKNLNGSDRFLVNEAKEILCRTEADADCIAHFLEALLNKQVCASKNDKVTFGWKVSI